MKRLSYLNREFFSLIIEVIQMLRDLLRNPSMMKDLVPFVIGLQSKENRTRLSWNVEDMFMWIAYEEKTLDLKWAKTQTHRC